MSNLSLAAASAAALLPITAGLAQQPDSYLVGWGDVQFDSRLAGVANWTRLGSGDWFGVGLRSDGSISSWGQLEGGVPDLPSGLHYKDVAALDRAAVAIRSDGQVIGWGGRVPLPTYPYLPPPGVHYTEVRGGGESLLLLRSDGQLELHYFAQFPQTPVPTVPPATGGLTYVDADLAGLSFGDSWGAALRSDGAVVTWGSRAPQAAPPSPPVGVTYTSVRCGETFGLLLRSDGGIDGWGSSTTGVLSIPALPPGLRYTSLDCNDRGAIACLSDGRVVAWGATTVTSNIVTPPSGGFAEVCAGGQLLAWSATGKAELIHPGPTAGSLRSIWLTHAPAAGITWSKLTRGGSTAAALRRDGGITSFAGSQETSGPGADPVGSPLVDLAVHGDLRIGLLANGQIIQFGRLGPSMPPPPQASPGTTWIKVFVNGWTALALRSDGILQGWSRYPGPIINSIPAPPASRRVLDVAMADNHAIALLDDGTLHGWGIDDQGELNLPPPQPGNPVVQVVTGYSLSGARLADGSVLAWGTLNGQIQTPQQVFWEALDIACSNWQLAALTPNGSVVHWGHRSQHLQAPVPTGSQGYVDIEGGEAGFMGLVGQRAAYHQTLIGCALSQGYPDVALHPQNRPLMGEPFSVAMPQMPGPLTLIWTGPDMIAPLPAALADILANHSLSICQPSVRPDLFTLVAREPAPNGGQWGHVTWQIPADPNLIGGAFRQQAVFTGMAAPFPPLATSPVHRGVIGSR